ncbi:HD domain-containing phosphohydrolase [Pelagicoccus mobilis]|uniref:Response regulator n=1 Tax=Pelagicoccus mobilis TaxID=415221 RepID=A0A934RZ33_9BACT|nr:HD domain-containing phosphohydrolase [Pelagicoccus mobilis]MBK1879251.1 response regulator [Pelagicoccus mobilis]
MRISEPRSSNILVLDDDEIVLLAMKETLEREGYKVTAFTSPNEAIQAVGQNRYSTIISDHRMPEMTGLEFLDQCKQMQPNASRILITGVLTLNTVVEAVNKGEIFRFLAKPWIREELLATVENAVQRYALVETNEKLQADTLDLNEKLVASNSALEEKVQQLQEQTTALDEANQALERNFSHSLEICFRLIEAFHPILGQQTKSVVSICSEIAKSDLLEPRDAEVLKVASWLYNLGRIGLPRDLVSKSLNDAQSLTESEEILLQHYPVYGQTLANFVENLNEVGQAIRYHRERFDGIGYPDKLSRESIPIPARHLAVAVGFVECNLPRDQALEFIIRESGRAYHPEAVRLFMKSSNLTNLPKKVKEITLAELEPGMVLAKGIYSPSGLLLIPEEKRLTGGIIGKIKEHDFANPITQRLMVFR